LIRHGFDIDVAFSLDDATRAAFCIIVSEQGGREFDWDQAKYKDE
jgi:hypothetical protein